MKTFFLTLFNLLFLLQVANTQNLSLGPEQKGKRTDVIQDIIHHDKTGFYALRQSVSMLKASAPIIEKYTSKMDRVYQTRLEEFSSPNINDQAYFSFKNRIYVAGSKKDKSKRRIEYFFQEISKKSGEMTGRVNVIGKEPLEKKSDVANLAYRISSDSTKLGLFMNDFDASFSFLGLGKKANEDYARFTLKVFDDNLEEQWSRKVRLPYNKDRLKVIRFDVDNKGDVYVLARYREENWRQKKRAKEPYYSYKILAYRKGGDKVDEYDVTLDNNYISDITFDIDKRDNLTCSGFFSEDFKGGLAGTFIFTIDAKTKKITSEDTKKFDFEELSLFMKTRKAKKGKEISSSFVLDDLVLRSDGGAVLVGESFYITTTTSTSSSGVTTTRTIYHYGPIIIVNVNPDGKIEWVNKIDKRQSSSSQAYSSYAKSVVGNKIYFVFNKGIRKKANVMAVSINSKGEISEKELFRIKDEKMVIRVPGCEQIGKREMIVYGEWGKKFRFGKLKF